MNSFYMHFKVLPDTTFVVTVDALVILDVVVLGIHMYCQVSNGSCGINAKLALVISDLVMNCFYMHFKVLLQSTFVVTVEALVILDVVVLGIHMYCLVSHVSCGINAKIGTCDL
jgi:hypothetical protein